MTRRSFLKALGAITLASALSIDSVLKNDLGLERFKPTIKTFADMLNEYMPQELLREELMKRDYLLAHVRKDNWRGVQF